MAFAAQQKKAIHSMLANKLTHLKIPDSSSSSSPPPTDPDFDFSDVFGAPTSPSSSSSFLTDPQIIHSRSHSFVGPSPRITLSKPLPFHQEVDSEGESDSDKVNTHVGTHQTECSDGIEEISGDEGSAVTKFGPGDFEILRMIGKGSFGKVFQVKMKGYGGEGEGDGILAMKVMRKDTVIKNNHVDYMRAERDILTKVEHPFIVQLRYSFQTKSKLYLILDFINGGHLFYHLYRQGIFSEDQARIYAAEIVSAVSHLHQRGIVHRDLKPENILMDGDGHVIVLLYSTAGT